MRARLSPTSAICFSFVAALAIPFDAAASSGWKSFRWQAFGTGPNVIDKGAIMLPVRLDEMNCEMQLDTGAWQSVLYRNALPSRYSRMLDSDSVLIKRFTLGETHPQVFPLLYQKRKKAPKVCGSKDGTRVVGTIGNDLLSGSNISVNLIAGKFKVRDGMYERANFSRHAPIDFRFDESERHGRGPVVTVTLADKSTLEMGFDTGSASTSFLLLSREKWLAIVGLRDIATVQPQLVPVWGQLVPCYSAPIQGPAYLGSFKIVAGARAVYCDDPRADANAASPVAGFLGLAPFMENVLTLDYVHRKLFIETPEEVLNN